MAYRAAHAAHEEPVSAVESAAPVS
jgi:hypothetical protein